MLNRDQSIILACKSETDRVYCMSKGDINFDPYADLNPATRLIVKTLGLFDNGGIPIALDQQGRKLVVSFNRNSAQGVFQYRDLQLLAALCKHIKNAYLLYQMLSNDNSLSAMRSSLAQVPMPIAMFNVDQKLVFANSMFDALAKR